MYYFLIQNALSLFPVRHIVAQENVKLFAVVGIEKMDQLMQDNVIDIGHPGFDKVEVKGHNVTGDAAAAPQGAHLTNEDTGPCNAVFFNDGIPLIHTVV